MSNFWDMSDDELILLYSGAKAFLPWQRMKIGITC
jgi:hypothetical protein